MMLKLGLMHAWTEMMPNEVEHKFLRVSIYLPLDTKFDLHDRLTITFAPKMITTSKPPGYYERFPLTKTGPKLYK